MNLQGIYIEEKKEMPKSDEKILEKIWVISQDNQKELNEISGHVAVLNQEMGDVREEIKGFKMYYVKKEEFSPVQKIVYSVVSAILLAVLGTLISLVVKR